MISRAGWVQVESYALSISMWSRRYLGKTGVHFVARCSRVETQSYPECDEDCDCDGGEEVAGQLVVARCNAPPILDAAEGVLDQMPVTIAGLVIDDLALATDPAGNDWDDAGLAQVFADGVGVIALVCEKIARFTCPVQQQARRRDVRDIACGQFEGIGASEGVGERVDLGCLTTAGRSDRLVFRPPLPPWAER